MESKIDSLSTNSSCNLSISLKVKQPKVVNNAYILVFINLLPLFNNVELLKARYTKGLCKLLQCLSFLIHVCQGWKIQNTCIKNSVQLTFSFQCLSAVAPLPSSECQPTGKKEKKKKLLILLTVFNSSVQILRDCTSLCNIHSIAYPSNKEH